MIGILHEISGLVWEWSKFYLREMIQSKIKLKNLKLDFSNRKKNLCKKSVWLQFLKEIWGECFKIKISIKNVVRIFILKVDHECSEIFLKDKSNFRFETLNFSILHFEGFLLYQTMFANLSFTYVPNMKKNFFFENMSTFKTGFAERHQRIIIEKFTKPTSKKYKISNFTFVMPFVRRVCGFLMDIEILKI